MRFDRLRAVLAFLAVSIVVPAVVSCALILPFLALANRDVLLQHGWVGGFWTIWSERWLTNTVSVLVFVPVILVWFTNGLAWFRDISPRRYIEACVLAGMLVAVSLAVFGGTRANAYLYPALFLVPLPLLLWASVRFGSTGASTSIAAVVCISGWCAYRGEGPFVEPASIDMAISMQMFWILLAVPLLPLSALIQEHRAARMALVESEDQFRHLFEQASIGVALESLEGRLTLVNPAFCSILGYSERELLQMSCVSISHPEDAATEKPLFQELMSGQRPSYQLEKRFFRKDGTQMWGHVSVSLLKGRNGVTPLVIGMLKDVTARKTAESQLRASEARLQSTLDLLPASILIVDEAGKIIEVNARCRELAGTEEPRYPSFRAGANFFRVCEATVGENSELARAVAKGVRRLLVGETQADPPVQLYR